MNEAIEVLAKQRQKLLIQKEEMLSNINKQISDVEAAIERLSGKHVWEVDNEVVYDDENPDYIKGSIEEM